MHYIYISIYLKLASLSIYSINEGLLGVSESEYESDWVLKGPLLVDLNGEPSLYRTRRIPMDEC